MQNNIARTLLAAPALAALLALGACGDRVENTEMPQPDRPNVEINRQGLEGAGKDQVAEERHGASPIMGGVGNGAPQDGVALDARIATGVRQALRGDATLAGMQVDVSAQDGEVKLRGHAPDDAARDRAGQLAGNVRDVKSVDNELTVG